MKPYPHWLERAARAAIVQFEHDKDQVAVAADALQKALPGAIDRAAASLRAQRAAAPTKGHWASNAWAVGPLIIWESFDDGRTYDVILARDDEEYSLRGFDAVARHIAETLNQAHGRGARVTLADIHVKLRSLRVALSRNGGFGTLRLEYLADERRVFLTCEISRDGPESVVG